MIIDKLVLGLIVCFGIWLIYLVLPRRVKKFMAENSLKDVLVYILTYTLIYVMFFVFFILGYIGLVNSEWCLID